MIHTHLNIRSYGRKIIIKTPEQMDNKPTASKKKTTVKNLKSISQKTMKMTTEKFTKKKIIELNL